jgi:transposase-like protein
MLGITQATTEHSDPIPEMFKDRIGHRLCFDEDLLVVIAGSKGLAKAVGSVLGSCAVIQRCQVHKVANILHHLDETDRKLWKWS